MHKYSDAKLEGLSSHPTSHLQALLIQPQEDLRAGKKIATKHLQSAQSCSAEQLVGILGCIPEGFISAGWLKRSNCSSLRLGGTLQSGKAKLQQSQPGAWVWSWSCVKLWLCEWQEREER